MSWSVKSQGHSNPENPEGRGRFFESNHFKCVISLFLLPSFPFSLLWQRQQTFVSWEALDLALPLVDPEKKDTRKSAFATSQLRFSKGICLEALMLLWNAKTRIHPWLFRLPRLWLPFPLPNLQINKQAGAISALQLAALLGCPSSSRLPTYRPARSQPPVLALAQPWAPCPPVSPGAKKQSPWNSPLTAPQCWGQCSDL